MRKRTSVKKVAAQKDNSSSTWTNLKEEDLVASTEKPKVPFRNRKTMFFRADLKSQLDQEILKYQGLKAVKKVSTFQTQKKAN